MRMGLIYIRELRAELADLRALVREMRDSRQLAGECLARDQSEIANF